MEESEMWSGKQKRNMANERKTFCQLAVSLKKQQI